MKGCIFCEIAAGNVKSEIVHRNPSLMVLKDINPQAPVHLLVVPTKHFTDIEEAVSSDPELVSFLIAECSRLGQEQGGDMGYRIVINTGENGGQTVQHLHFHVLAGRALQWPPG